jgi:predicted ATPase
MNPTAVANGPLPRNKGTVYKVVLTGGPCAGKTTTLSRLGTFFESLGWKVYMVPETATLLLGGGVKFSELTPEQAMLFQQQILATLLEVERTFDLLAECDSRNVLIVCDRGSMDPFAFCSKSEWQEMLDYVKSNPVELRDNRYDQVVHMVTAASGAESFYQLDNNSTRSEGFELARERDTKAAESWVGHPYFDIVDNSTGFEEKIHRVIEKVCERMRKRGIELHTEDRLKAHSKKRKFLIKSLPDEKEFPAVQDFDVQHDYIESRDGTVQSRIRKRGQKGLMYYSVHVYSYK